MGLGRRSGCVRGRACACQAGAYTRPHLAGRGDGAVQRVLGHVASKARLSAQAQPQALALAARQVGRQRQPACEQGDAFKV